VDPRPAQVAVDDGHSASVGGKRAGEVRHDGRLALDLAPRGDDDRHRVVAAALGPAARHARLEAAKRLLHLGRCAAVDHRVALAVLLADARDLPEHVVAVALAELIAARDRRPQPVQRGGAQHGGDQREHERADQQRRHALRLHRGGAAGRAGRR
jgi:hypothetical protein